MGINKYIPHILILPEDDANRQIANGFINSLNVNEDAIQILNIADGWKKVIEKFKDNYVLSMKKLPKRRMVLLIDFDKQEENRLIYVKDEINEIAGDLQERVFVIGVQSKPEKLKSATKMSFEEIGQTLAKDCAEDTNQLWGHDLLKHNDPELKRLAASVKLFLFK